MSKSFLIYEALKGYNKGLWDTFKEKEQVFKDDPEFLGYSKNTLIFLKGYDKFQNIFKIWDVR